MILGQQEPGHRSQTSQSSHYSQHSSLLTDLSLTPSPPSKAPLSISTPSNLSDPSLESEPRNESSTEPPSRPETQQPAVDNKHENQEQSAPVEEESTCRRISEAQEDDEQTDDGSPAKGRRRSHHAERQERRRLARPRDFKSEACARGPPGTDKTDQ